MSNAEITVPARAASQYDDLLKQKKKNKRKADFKRLLPLYLMMLPGLVYLQQLSADVRYFVRF